MPIEGKKIVIDYKKSDVKCPKCWYLNIVKFPEEVTRQVQFWNKLKAF